MKRPSGVPKFKHDVCKMCGTPLAVMNGQRLRVQREAAGLTLREFAARLGYSAPYLCDVEYNRRRCTPKIRAAYEALEG